MSDERPMTILERAQVAATKEIIRRQETGWKTVDEWEAEITRLSSELAASRERERALERERDDAVGKREVWHRYCVRVLKVHRERTKAAEAEVKRLRLAADYIAPYLRWTISDESPGHHPTMPSAVAAFHDAFDISTAEKRLERTTRALADAQGGGKDG